jgi:hypothetical protein
MAFATDGGRPFAEADATLQQERSIRFGLKRLAQRFAAN